ncbi:MAG: 4Fe-4S dicluster domain-containing protein, partial [Anaerolineae bacterium]
MSISPLSALAEHMYLNCIRCGACLPVCPTYREGLHEAASPRGRVALARKEIEGELAASENLREHMNTCLGCMACNEVCPVGIRPSALVLSVRGRHEQQGPELWKQAVFGGLISQPARMELLTLPLRLYQHLGVRRLVSSPRLRSRARLRDLESMLPPLPRRPLRGRIPECAEPTGESRYRVGYFLGCAQSLLFAEQSAATVRVLRR